MAIHTPFLMELRILSLSKDVEFHNKAQETGRFLQLQAI
jgi:hypothetical protein